MRQHLGDHTLDPNLPRDAACRALVVAGEEDRLQAELLQLAHGLAARGFERVLHDEPRTRLTVPRHGDRPAAPCNLDLAILDDSVHADAGDVSETGHRRQAPHFTKRRSHDCTSNGMLAGRLDSAGETKHVEPRSAVQGRDFDEDQLSGGDSAGLVEDDGADATRLLENFGPFDQDAELRPAPGPDQQGRRRREPERAGTGNDQHRDRRRESLAHIPRDGQPADESAKRNDQHDGDEHS